MPEVSAATAALAEVEAGDERRSWEVLEREAERLRLIATEAAAEASVEDERFAAAAAALADADRDRATAAADVRAAAARVELATSALNTLVDESETTKTRIAELSSALDAQVAAAAEAAAAGPTLVGQGG